VTVWALTAELVKTPKIAFLTSFTTGVHVTRIG